MLVLNLGLMGSSQAFSAIYKPETFFPISYLGSFAVHLIELLFVKESSKLSPTVFLRAGVLPDVPGSVIKWCGRENVNPRVSWRLATVLACTRF